MTVTEFWNTLPQTVSWESDFINVGLIKSIGLFFPLGAVGCSNSHNAHGQDAEVQTSVPAFHKVDGNQQASATQIAQRLMVGVSKR